MSRHLEGSAEPCLHALVAALPHAILALAADLGLLAANEKACALFGWTDRLPTQVGRADAGGTSLARAELWRLVESSVTQVAQGHSGKSSMCLKGQRTHQRWQVQAGRLQLGAHSSVFLVQIDSLLIEYPAATGLPLSPAMADAFCLVQVERDADGQAHALRIRKVNEAFTEYAGKKDVRGHSLHEVCHGSPANWLHLCAKVAASGRQCLVREALQRGERWYDVLLAPASDSDQHHVAVVLQDATERTRTARRLQRSERAARQAAEQARLERRRLEATISALPVGVYMVDLNGYVLHSNPEASRLWGVTGRVEVPLGSYARWNGWWADHSPRHGQPLAMEDWPMMRALQGESCRDVIEIETLDEPPLRRILEMSAAPIRDSDGRIDGAVAAIMDLSDRVRTEDELRHSTERFSKIVHQAATGVIETDAVGNLTLVNRKFCDLLGYTENELIGRNVMEITDPESVPESMAAAEQLETGVADFVIEKRYRRRNGGILWATTSVSALRDEHGHYQGRVAIVVDITQQKLAEEQLRHASLHDSLTGLPNRAMLYEYAGHLLSHNRRTRQTAAVLFLDLDRFKPINDTHGHEVGDMVLKRVAERLVGSMRAEDLVVRLGGDEFIVLLQDIRDAVYAAEVANHLIEHINEPYQVGELSLSISTSIGISMFPDDAGDIDTLVSHADMAMYQAKQAGRSNFQFYSFECSVRSRLQLWIEDKLKASLRRGEFHLYYQPVVDVVRGGVVSAEALLRWGDSEIGPERFVPVAEATGIINPISRWLLGEASRQHKLWCDHGLPPIPIAVNVSVVEFRDRGFAERVERALAEQGVATEAIQLELTETAVMDDVDHAVAVLTRLKELGVKILLDDFGTGHSSLSQLVRLPLNKVKIDKSFVGPLDENDGPSCAVTSAMISLAVTLGLEVVAEGVESERALNFISEHGCTQAQGFYIGMPMEPDAFEHWYRSYQPASSTSSLHS
jgi:diguanylate cyclase (GGDEF)-like protein/PAS domain S-box-containing protein